VGQCGTAGQGGWAIPIATDIAFVVGCLALLGSRVPHGLKILALSPAIVDDILAVLVIALFYAAEIKLTWLAAAVGGFSLISLLNRLGVRTVPVYVFVGAAIWLCTLKSGVHPTVAGVALGLMTPARAWLGRASFLDIMDRTIGLLRRRDAPPGGGGAWRPRRASLRLEGSGVPAGALGADAPPMGRVLMRCAPGHKQRTRDRLTAAAARLFKLRGYSGVGVHAVMEAEGLTAGGFYAHFPSKEALLEETLMRAMAQTHRQFFAGLTHRHGWEWLREAVRRYLSRSHRDGAAEGCPLPALSAEVARASKRTREAFDSYLKEFVLEFEGALPEKLADRREHALATVSLCVGGIVLARAVADRNLSDLILRSCRQHILISQPEQKDLPWWTLF
jgi:AcrR family transcriptional regulator